jgi:hypothetical protein
VQRKKVICDENKSQKCALAGQKREWKCQGPKLKEREGGKREKRGAFSRRILN